MDFLSAFLLLPSTQSLIEPVTPTFIQELGSIPSPCLTFTHTHTHNPMDASGILYLPRHTSPCRLEEPGSQWGTIWVVEDRHYLLSHSCPTNRLIVAMGTSSQAFLKMHNINSEKCLIWTLFSSQALPISARQCQALICMNSNSILHGEKSMTPFHSRQSRPWAVGQLKCRFK